MKPLMARWMLLWLEANHVSGLRSEHMLAYLTRDCAGLEAEAWDAAVEARAEARQIELALHLTCICAISALYLRYISPISPLYLAGARDRAGRGGRGCRRRVALPRGGAGQRGARAAAPARAAAAKAE